MPPNWTNEDSPLKQRREQFGYTQRELADRLEVTVQTLSNWETGRFQKVRLTISQLKKLCQLLDWTIATLPDRLGPVQPRSDD